MDLRFIYRLSPWLSRFPEESAARLYDYLSSLCYSLGLDGWFFVQLARFFRQRRTEFKFGLNYCYLKDLRLRFRFDELDLLYLANYFRERDNYKFTSAGESVFMEIADLKFHIPFPHGILELLEVYRDEIYGYVDVNGGVVLDIGAFIGDSAVYFSKKGAESVVAFEPVKSTFDLAVENVHINKKEDCVELRNCAVAKENGVGTLMFVPYHPGSSSLYSKPYRAVREVVSLARLADIIREFGSIKLLKMDCEGAEHDLILDVYQENVLRYVENLTMEIHGSPLQIISTLKKANFDIVRITKIDAVCSLLFAKQ